MVEATIPNLVHLAATTAAERPTHHVPVADDGSAAASGRGHPGYCSYRRGRASPSCLSGDNESMLVVGFAVDLPKRLRPVLSAAVLRDTAAPEAEPALTDIEVVDTFEVVSPASLWAEILGELAKAAAGRLRTIDPEAVVVRRADRPVKPSNADGPRLALLAVGAVTASAHNVVPRTVVRTGKECGTAWGDNKAGVDAAAATLVEKKFVPAAAAALSGLRADRL